MFPKKGLFLLNRRTFEHDAVLDYIGYTDGSFNAASV